MIKLSQAATREGMHNVVDHLVPELRRHGVFRTHYEGRTLRENLSS